MIDHLPTDDTASLPCPPGTDRALFRADWINVAFVHFAVDPGVLQPIVPVELDLFAGEAFVSLVAFTQKRLRPAWGGWLARALAHPLADHEFLNLRTYVRHRGERGIFFLCEWIPNRLALLIGPRTYGLPYRWGRHRYRRTRPALAMDCLICAAGERLRFRASASERLHESSPDSRDQFLLERYVAFTHRAGRLRRFVVEHPPWPQAAAHAELEDLSLLRAASPFAAHLRLAGANISPGVTDVLISAPQVAHSPAPRLRLADQTCRWSRAR